ncbi:MAG: oligosaccharide flippase family protein [Bacteroidetes bacterium]|nr:oligosaccharide flippase family protein [Bacteroidota bacterium]MCB0604380.1 oligosaccharide flippase family protein [Saprospiraceae bacterium]
MKELLKFFKEFIQNNGLLVFSAMLIAKLSMLIINIAVARLIPKEEFGLIALVFSVFAIFAPLTGLGSYQGLLRYGVLEKDQHSRDRLSQYVFHRGLFNHIAVCFMFLGISYIYTLKYGDLKIIILLFGIRILGYYFQNFIESYYRINHNNKTFAWVNISINLGGLVMAFIGMLLWGLIGYLIAMAIMPWISLIFLKRNIFVHNNFALNINKKEFWKYSLHGSMTYFLSDILFSMDFLLIGLLLSENDLAMYKTAIIIPMNLSILPLVFMQTDYPKLAKNYQNKNYLNYYIKNYYKIFIPLGVVILFIGWMIQDDIVSWIFGEKYAGNGSVFIIILFALVGNMWLRNLYGNLASAVGKANWNTYTSLIGLSVILLLGLWLIPLYGIVGAAFSMAGAFTCTGIVTAVLFKKYLKNLDY